MKQKITWDDITVQQFQDLYSLAKEKNVDDIDKAIRVVCILFDMTENQVEEMRQIDFQKLVDQCSMFQVNDVPGKAKVKFIANGNKYKINYKPSELLQRQYVEILFFGEDPVMNMHLIMASLVNPVKWGRVKKNKAEMHQTIASDILQAPISVIYHSCVFFCNLYVNLIRAMEASLVAEMVTTKKITKQQAQALLRHSIDAMAGFITPHRLRSLNVLPLMPHTNSL